MAVNKNALIRYKTIDKCLQNNFRKWTLNDLIDACSDALYEYEGKDTYVSKRTVQLDLQMMRSDKLGYNAPIEVYERKYYRYADEDYSITNSPLSDQDLAKLSESVAFLKQFQGFSHFRELDGMIQKLEAHVYAQKTNQKSVIDFEKNEHLKGLEHLDTLYKAVINKQCLKITYKSFKARDENTFNFHPYLLKEFRNRWFVIGCTKVSLPVMNLALDRIISIAPSDVDYQVKPYFNGDVHFKDVIGVTVSQEMEPEEFLIYVSNKHAPYVLTKPFHASQQLVERNKHGITISLKVQHNFELEKDLLGLGDGIKVLTPSRLRRNIRARLTNAVDNYDTELSDSGLKAAVKKLTHNGVAVLQIAYTKREVNRMKQLIDTFMYTQEAKPFAQRCILHKVPGLKDVLINKNLKAIITAIDGKAVLTKAIYFDKPPKDNWYVTWHQDVPINVTEKVTVEGYNSWTKKEGIHSVCPPEEVLHNTFTIRVHLDDADDKNGALKVLPGSHKKRFSDEEIKLITGNSYSYTPEVASGGIMLMRPLLLHASSKAINKKRRRVLHLEFSSSQLPEGLTWLEREVVFE